jgi:hypothetical protein
MCFVLIRISSHDISRKSKERSSLICLLAFRQCVPRDNFEILIYEKPSFSPGGFGLSLSQLMRRDPNWPKFPPHNSLESEKNLSHQILPRDFQKQVVKRPTSIQLKKNKVIIFHLEKEGGKIQIKNYTMKLIFFSLQRASFLAGNSCQELAAPIDKAA